MSRRISETEWEEAKNLGDVINTGGDEISPFIHANGITLYFANDSRPGFGGYDIFYSNLVDGEWQEPVNLGNPVNTIQDQVSLFISSDGSKGYYSHEERESGRRRSYLYSFDMPQALKKIPFTSYVKGRVLDSKTLEPLRASVSLYDIAKEDELVEQVVSDPVTGEYFLSLTDGFEYALYADRKGYLFNTETFRKDRSNSPIEVDILLSPIEEGARTILNNIFFDFDSDRIKNESMSEINNIVAFLNANPDMKIVVEGHTDNVGQDAYNMDLSNRRAKSVKQSLVKKGINSERISFEGYGSTRPLADNTTEQNRAQNRRIEFRIL